MTLWTTVLAAGRESSANAEDALARLCQTYWPPVYAYVRKRTPSVEQAQDLTQGFFARLLEKNYLARAEKGPGRFWSFLLTSVDNFLCDEYVRSTSLTRGGGRSPISLDLARAQELNTPVNDLTPALAFEKRWVRALLEQVLKQLRKDYENGDRLRLFAYLQAHL